MSSGQLAPAGPIRQPGEAAEWRIDVAHDGRYEVQLAFSCRAADAGGRLRLSVGDQSLNFAPAATPSASVFHRAVLGDLKLSEGPATLRARGYAAWV